jgi:hypothetical protein
VESIGEKLESVSFNLDNPNASYEVYASVDGSMENRLLVATGKSAYPGYQTVDLDSPVSLVNPEFAVFVKIAANGVASLPVEKNLSKVLETATSKPGQSFASPDGANWLDVAVQMPDANLCLRAWTTASSAK